VIARKNGVRSLRVEQPNYATSIQEIPVPTGVQGDASLPEDVPSAYRGAVGRLNWLAHRSRPDLVFPVWSCSRKVSSPTWADVRDVNKAIRAARLHKSTGITMNPMGSQCRVISLSDASFSRHHVEPSVYACLSFISDYVDDFDQNYYKRNPETVNVAGGETQLINATLVFWRPRMVIRRVDIIMDVETLSIAYATNCSAFLNCIITELDMNRKKIKPLTFNDNNSTISHIVSDNRHKNMRLNVIWGALRESYTKNVFGLLLISAMC